MSKKWAISLVLLGEALIYLFLFVGVSALEDLILCPTCTARELFPTPLALYFVPGLIGLLFIVVILKQKKENGKLKPFGDVVDN